MNYLFDERPIDIGGFRLSAKAAVPIEAKPGIQGWQLALQFASATEESAGFWVGDLLAYATDRKDWREKIDQAQSVTKLARHTLENMAVVARKVTGRARELAPTHRHAELVTKLEPAEQEELLERARDEEWTTRELGQAVKSRGKVLAGQAPEVHEVIVSVCISVEAKGATAAERLAWDAVKPYAKEIAKDSTVLSARIVGAKARQK
jgi:hypothetical protein